MKNDVTDVNYIKKIRSFFNIRTALILLAILIGVSLGGVAIGNFSTNAKAKEQITLGNKYLQEGNYKEAIIAFEKAIEIQPKNVEARLGLAKAYTAVGRTTAAIRVLKEVIDIDKKREEVYIELAKLYIDENKLDEAMEILGIGYENTGNEEIKKMLDELKAKPHSPKASIEAGKYKSIQQVELVSEGSDIYYTLDGTKPSIDSIKYSQPVTISNGRTILRAIAVDAKGKISEEIKYDYTVDIPKSAVSFEDKEFEKMLRKIINRASGEIYNTDLINIKEIKIFGVIAERPTWIRIKEGVECYSDKNGIEYTERGKIKSLNDIKWFTNLEILYVGYQEITDIIVLEDMKNLKSVDLSFNKVTDISQLKSLSQLDILNLQYNAIRDITPVKGLVNLKHLNLSEIRINNISWLSNFTKLEDLNLTNTQVSDISPLEKLTDLQGLSLGANQINDLKSLSSLTKLKRLYVYRNMLTDISPLKSLINLEFLDLAANKISDISSLKNFKNLKSLSLVTNQISDVRSLSTLTKLEKLYLGSNQITDISPLRNLTSLDELHLAPNNITDYSPLDNLKITILNKN